MAYEKVNWLNGVRAINESNMKKMDDGIAVAVNVQNITTANTDLNDYKTDGKFFFEGNYAPANIPEGSNGFLRVMTKGSWIKQIWYRAGTPGTNDHRTWVRTSSNSGSTWSDWDKYVNAEDNFPLYRGLIPVDDLNDLKTTGIYYTSSKTLTNTGLNYSDYSYSFIVVIALADGGFVIQVLIKPAQKKLRTREFSGSPASWKPWQECLQEETPFQTSLTLGDYFDTVDINKVLKTGHVVEVAFRGHTNAEIPNATSFATLPYKTKINTIIPIYTGGRYILTEPVFSYTGTNANTWSSAPIPANTWVQAHFTYITDE